MEYECHSCGSEFIIDYTGSDEITYCPICSSELITEEDIEIEEDYD